MDEIHVHKTKKSICAHFAESPCNYFVFSINGLQQNSYLPLPIKNKLASKKHDIYKPTIYYKITKQLHLYKPKQKCCKLHLTEKL